MWLSTAFSATALTVIVTDCHMFFPTALIADTYEVCLHAHMGKKKKKITLTNWARLNMCMLCSNVGTVKQQLQAVSQ